MKPKLFLSAGLFALAGMITACGPTSTSPDPSAIVDATDTPADAEAAETEVTERPQEATSFGGEPLYRFDIPAERLAETEAQIAALEAKPEKTEDDFINLGYMYINAGQFNGAIELYTRGLEQYPESFKLLRHRGHRYINTRQLDKAIIDLERAVDLMGDNSSDVLQFRLSGEAFGTYEHWVWYHIALYYYLNEDYSAAAAAYETCVSTANNNQVLVGATDWLYNAYMKNGEPEKAMAALENVPADIDINPNYSYFQRVLVYKGLSTPEDFLDLEKPGVDWDGREITSGYGMANWYKWNGQPDKAQLIYDKILETPFWSSWAYVVTDREQSRAP